jgi:hypothetical protein
MQININELSLPTHILLALKGELTPAHNITSIKKDNALQRVTDSVTVNLQSDIDSPFYEIELTQLSDLTSFDVLE